MGWAVHRGPALRARARRSTSSPLLITGRRVAGSSFGGVKAATRSPSWCPVARGDVDVDPLISHRITLDEVNRGSS